MQELIDNARAFAIAAHAGETRRDGVTPYSAHLERVAANVRDECKPAAWLHDVIENTNCTPIDLINAGFPTAVVETVCILTKIHGEPYEKYIRRINDHCAARAIKLADIADNSRDAATMTDYQRAKYPRALAILNT
jgi:(p)ppGpp synthase/HD superfamily hydrolase